MAVSGVCTFFSPIAAATDVVRSIDAVMSVINVASSANSYCSDFEIVN